MVILVEALNMHENSEGFAGLYPLSSTEAAAPWGEKVRQRAKPSGKQGRVTVCGILDHHPLHTKQHLKCHCCTHAHSSTDVKRKPATQIH